MRLIKRWFPEALIVIGTLTASSALLAAIFTRRLLAGDDATSYPLFLSTFHENIIRGNFFPIWSADMTFGYGEPMLLYRQPLQTYLTGLIHLVIPHPFVALNLSGLIFLVFAAAGMYFLAKCLVDLFFPESIDAHSWGVALAVVGYILSPYVLYDIYSRAAFSETSCFSVFPWLTLALIRLATAPTLRNIAVAAFTYCCLSLSHPVIHMISAPFILATSYIFRQKIKSWLAWGAAIAWGMLMSTFYWLPVIIEKNATKSVLASIGSYDYSIYFCRLDELLSIPWRQTRGGSWCFPGFTFLFGVIVSLWLWTQWKRNASQTSLLARTVLTLLLFSGLCVYFMHPVSAVWYESFSWLRMLQFPTRFLCPLTFFSCLLTFMSGSIILKRSWQWILLLGLIFVYGVQGVRRAEFSEYGVEHFTSAVIARGAWSWGEAYFFLPTTVPFKPTAPPEQLVDVTAGSAELQCSRKGPTIVECLATIITPATLRLNVFDFPGWTTLVDGRPTLKTGRDPIHGTLLVSLDQPGLHNILWELRDTWDRQLGKILTLIGWIGILLPLLRTQIRDIRLDA